MNGFQYQLKATLPHHTDSIVVLQFSPRGDYLASASDNGVILIYCTSSWKPIRRFIDVSPVSVLLWHNKTRNVLLCGHRSGDLHLVDVSKSTNAVVETARFSGSIHSLAISPSADALAIGNGHNVQLVSFSSKAPYLKGNQKKLPDPPVFSHLSSRLPAPIARSIHFQKGGKTLVISYLSHGVIFWDISKMTSTWQITPRACSMLSGRSDLHPDGTTIAVSNLFDGVDWYSTSPPRHAYSVKIPISDNLPTPLSYIDNGSAILVGGTSGKAHIIDCKSLNVLQVLDHNENGCVQSVCFSPNFRGRTLIATGNAEPTNGAMIKVWFRPVRGKWEVVRRFVAFVPAVYHQHQSAAIVALVMLFWVVVRHLPHYR